MVHLVKAWAFLRSIPGWAYGALGWVLAFLLFKRRREDAKQLSLSIQQLKDRVERRNRETQVIKEHDASRDQLEQDHAEEKEKLDEKETQLKDADPASLADEINKVF